MCVDPTQRLTFLGVELDTVNMCMRIPADKLRQVKQELLEFSKRRRATKPQLQSLCGKLGWLAAIVFGGRVFLHRIIDLITTIKGKTNRVCLSTGMWQDINWWLMFMETFNGRLVVLDKQPITMVYTDACNAGSGSILGSDWFYCNWTLDWPAANRLHINYKELLAIVIAATCWAPYWQGKRLYILSNNQAMVGMLNRGTARRPLVMHALRWLFWLSATHGFHLTGRYIPRATNIAADSAS